MPNHVHLVLTVADDLPKPFHRVLADQKRYSAVHANQLLGLTGPFWQAESYDHVLRSPRETARAVAYVLNNPVKAGLVAEWPQWPHTHLAP